MALLTSKGKIWSRTVSGRNTVVYGRPTYPSRITEVIDGREYTAVKIGNRYWITSNYIPSWEPINKGNGSHYLCWYGGKKLATSSSDRERGIYVRNTSSQTELQIISESVGNYRVPTYDDYLDLRAAIGGYLNGWKLLSVNAIGYDSFTLNDEYGFNWMNYGTGSPIYPFNGSYEWRADGSSYAYMTINLGLNFVDTDETSPYVAYVDRDTNYQGNLYASWLNKNNVPVNVIGYFPIRLCRDLDVPTVGE